MLTSSAKERKDRSRFRSGDGRYSPVPRHFTLLAVVAACLTSIVQPAGAQTPAGSWSQLSPAKQFGNDAMLAASLEDIAHMRQYEIEAFSRALADCDSVYLGDDEKRAVCTRSWDYFNLVYSRPDSPVGQLATAVRTVWNFLRVEDKAGKKENLAGGIARFTIIRDKWADSIRQRFKKLHDKGP